MNKRILWMMAAILSSSPVIFTSCDSQDNPVEEPLPPQDVKNADRAAIERVLSERLLRTAQDARFESAIELTKSFSKFLDTMDENVLKIDIGTFVLTVVSMGNPVEMSSLSALDKEAVEKCLKDQFNVSDYDLSTLESFIQINAHETLNKFHVILENNKCTYTDDAEAFTVEIVLSDTERMKFQAEFGNSDDDVCIFTTRVSDVVPLAIQLPKSFNVSLTTPDGHVVNGVINLSSTASSRYASTKSDVWTIGTRLTDTFNGREESITAQLSYGKDKYTDEYIDSDELKQLRDMGNFYAASYELIKVNKCKAVEDLTITLDEDIEVSISIDDVAKCLFALNNLRQLYGTQPTFFAVDTYTQELNNHIHFTVNQKSTNITAKGSLLTIKKGSKNEFQPGLALTFKGETTAQSMYENLSEEDLANYNKIVNKFNELVNECNTMVETFSDKIKVIASAFKI